MSDLTRIADLEAEIERVSIVSVEAEETMRIQLRQYGTHKPGCNWHEANNPDDCECGWEAIKRGLSE